MFFDRLFKKPQKQQILKTVDFSPSLFIPWTGDAYANDIYRSAVDAIARNAGRLAGVHLIRDGDLKTPAINTRLNRLLQTEPNPYMSAYDLLYKTVTHYYLHNNSFLFLQRDGNGVCGIYPLDVRQVEFLTDPSGEVYCRFRFSSGKEYTFPYCDIVHLRRNFNSNELLGDDNGALFPALELAHTLNEGISASIKSGATIRGVLKFTQLLAPEKMKEAKEQFVQDYLTMSNSGGVVATDQQTDYVPINSTPATVDAAQMKAAKEKIYDYLGISERIVNSSYTETEWAAFYESTLEPLAVQMSLEFTRKIFTKREQAFGNMIVFDSGRLQFTSSQTKVNLLKELLPYGLLTINQALEILNLPPVKDGDKRLQTLNVIDASKANQYQLGADTDERN